jgi:hypothetical protein
MKPTGPKTPHGKRRSAQNARRHGLLSTTIVLPGEDPKAFARLLAGYQDEYQPATRTDRDLVETIAVARWRQMRLWGMEKANMMHEIASHPDGSSDDHATRAALAFRRLSDTGHSLDLQHRYDARLAGQYYRVLQVLKARKNRKMPNELAQPVPFQQED